MDLPFLSQFEVPISEQTGEAEPAEAAASLSSGDRTGPKGEPSAPPPGSTREDWRVVLRDWDLDS